MTLKTVSAARLLVALAGVIASVALCPPSIIAFPVVLGMYLTISLVFAGIDYMNTPGKDDGLSQYTNRFFTSLSSKPPIQEIKGERKDDMRSIYPRLRDKKSEV